jgi:hypothetical protein
MVDLAYDWELMSWGMRAIVIALAVALVIVVLSPHVAFLKPVAERLGLVSTATQVIYVPVNHTVYVNQTIVKYMYVNKTVPVYINRTVYVTIGSNMSYFESYAGYCSGRLVILPNNTAWIVWFWLAPKAYFESIPYLQWWYFEYEPPVYYNSTTHYAQFLAYLTAAFFVSPQGLSLYGWAGDCYVDNVTINGYYVLACGDTFGIGPSMLNPIRTGGLEVVWNGTMAYEEVPLESVGPFISNNFIIVGNTTAIMPIPVENATYTGVMFLGYGAPPPIMNYIITPGPICDLTVTFATNATAALWLPVTTNQTLINYWNYAEDQTLGHHNPYDYTMGYQVWRYPS